MKSCPFCGCEAGMACDHWRALHWRRAAGDWNCRAMPECVRRVADELSASAETYRAIGDDLRADHCDGLLAELRKYYGVTL